MIKFARMALLLILAGCSFGMSDYSVQNQNMRLLRDGKNSVKVITEKPGFRDSGSILCRAAGAIQAPRGKTFSDYIADALKAELNANELLNQKSTNTLHVKFKRVDFSSAKGATIWYIDADYKTKQKTFFISTTYHDRSSFMARQACAYVARFFLKAVAKHLRQLYGRPEFRRTIRASQ